jgi:hypothetical protein
MMQLNRIPVAASLWLASLAAAQAHPGHRLGDHGALHVVSSPYHLIVLALIGASLFVASRFVHRRAPRRLMQGAGVAALVAMAALWGLRA